MPRHRTEAPGEAIEQDGAVVKASIGDEDKTTTHHSTMMMGYEMAAAVHRGLREHGCRYQESEGGSHGSNRNQMTHCNHSG
jgi:hypothetical protein